MTIQERRNQVRSIAGEHQAKQQFVVIPNDAPAYCYSGPWGVYDIERCEWVNFRATKAEAEALRDLISSDTPVCICCMDNGCELCEMAA